MDKNQKATINDLVITQAGENKGFLEQVKQTLLIVQEIHYTFLLLVGKYEKGEETQKELLKQAEDLLKNSQGNLEVLHSLKKEFDDNAEIALEQLESLQTQAKESQEAIEKVSKEFQESLEIFAKEKGEYKDLILGTELLLENIKNLQETLGQELKETQEQLIQGKEDLKLFEKSFTSKLQALNESLNNSENALGNAIHEAKFSIQEEAQKLKSQLQGILEQIKQGGADIIIAYDDTELMERIESLEKQENKSYDDTELRGRIESLENQENKSYDDTELRERITNLENQENTTLEMSAEFLSPIIQNTNSFLFLSNEILKAGVIHA